MKWGAKNKFEWTEDAHRILENKFGFKEFRKNQIEIINASMSKLDCFALIPTSGGKSLPF